MAQAGYDVSFIARGAHLAAMRDHGLLIENAPQGNIHVAKVRVTDDPATLGRADIVILSVKLGIPRQRRARSNHCLAPTPACCRCKTA